MSSTAPRPAFCLPLKGQWCVYTHTAHGVVFYVGKGRPHRPFDPNGRTQRWKDFVGKAGVYTVDIVLWTDNEMAAYEAERDLIRSIDPCCNGSHGRFTSAPMHQFALRISDPLYLAIVAAADKEKRSINAQMQVLLERGLAGELNPHAAGSVGVRYVRVKDGE